jgi:hypothetical protein
MPPALLFPRHGFILPRVFPIPDELSSDEEGGGEEGGKKGSEEGSEEGGEEESEDSEEDVPLARRKRKVARVLGV